MPTEEAKIEQAVAEAFAKMHPYRETAESYPALPIKGRDRQDIVRELRAMAETEDARWENGQVSGSYYHGGKDHYAFLNQVFSLFSHVNLLQRDMCPSGTKFEAEIVSMTAHLLHSAAAKARNRRDEVVGAVTSGGSESIMLAMLAYREQARDTRGVMAPEMVVPSTAHPAFDKGAHCFGIRLIRVPIGADFLADVAAMRAAITPRTIALAGTAVNYAHGLIDPLEALSDLALEHGIGLHVDGCLGGFLLPWVARLGYDIPPFDFRLPGVTSMSCDTHKWGFGLKGTSVILYHNRELRRYQYFSKTDWQGGLYASPTMAGSRSGGLTAATWAAMVSLGEEGYMEMARHIMRAADTIRHGAAGIPEIRIAGHPTYCIAFLSDEVNIFHVNDYLAGRGWRMNGLQNPPGFHFCVTGPQTAPGVAERFVADLRDAVAYSRNPPPHPPQSGILYGGGGVHLPAYAVNELLLAMLDEAYEL